MGKNFSKGQKMKKSFGLGFVGLVGFGLLFFYTQYSGQLSVTPIENKSEQRPEGQGLEEELQEGELPEDLNSSDPAAKNDESSNHESGDLKNFKSWLNQEVGRMTGSVKDAPSKELELEAKAKNLKPEELAYLGRNLQDFRAPANLRILAVFMLAKVGPGASSLLRDYIDSPMPELDPKPHSLDETRLMQEKAIRQMARQALESAEHPEK